MQAFIKTLPNSFTYCGDPSNILRTIFGNTPAYAQDKLLSPLLQFNQTPENTIITLIPSVIGGMQVSIRQLSGKTTTMDIDSGITVEELKQAIFQKERIPVENQTLYYAGQLMIDGRNISEYEVLPESNIHLIVNSHLLLTKKN